MLSRFQLYLLDEMEPGIWYDCFYSQGTGGALLPEWFYRAQTQPLATLRPMWRAGVIEKRMVGDWMKFPQVRKPEEEGSSQ